MTNELPKIGRYDNDTLEQRRVDALQITENLCTGKQEKISSSF